MADEEGKQETVCNVTVSPIGDPKKDTSRDETEHADGNTEETPKVQTIEVGDGKNEEEKVADKIEEKPNTSTESSKAGDPKEALEKDATTNIDEHPVVSPKAKKRYADRQITKDDDEDKDDAEDDQDVDESGPFKSASAEVLKQRRFVKAKRPNGPSPTDMPTIPEGKDPPVSNSPKANPFGKIAFSAGSGFGKFSNTNPLKSAASSSSTFGSGTAFGSAAAGFPFIKKTEKNETDDDSATRASPSNLGVFGRGATICGFGGASGFGFGGTVPSTSFGSVSKDNETDDPTTESVFLSTEAGDPANGEENEKCILQHRAKLYRLVEKKENPSQTEGEESEKKEDEKDSQKKEATAEKEWKEVGTGPVRVLQHLSEKGQYRIVQRRETSPGGAGTKLILNVKVTPTETHVERHGEKHIRLTTIVAEEVSIQIGLDLGNFYKLSIFLLLHHEFQKATGTFLFKVKTVVEAEELIEAIRKTIEGAAISKTTE